MEKNLRGRAPPKTKTKPIKKIIRKLGSAAERIILSLFAAAALVVLIMSAAGLKPEVVLSGSMEPALKTGSIAFLDTSARKPAAGEIITYQAGDMTVTHRLVRETPYGYVTKGDANAAEDAALVSEEQILGTVRFSVPLLGYVIIFMQTRSAVLLTAGLCMAGAWHAVKIMRKAKKKETDI